MTKTFDQKEYNKQYMRDRQRTRVSWCNWAAARIPGRVQKLGIPCDITAGVLLGVYPKDGYCPIYRLPFVLGEGNHPMMPSVDRLIPELGYVAGNVRIISNKANRLKSNCTDPRVFDRLASYLGLSITEDGAINAALSLPV